MVDREKREYRYPTASVYLQALVLLSNLSFSLSIDILAESAFAASRKAHTRSYRQNNEGAT